jgi:hypothetical protein
VYLPRSGHFAGFQPCSRPDCAAYFLIVGEMLIGLLYQQFSDNPDTNPGSQKD